MNIFNRECMKCPLLELLKISFEELWSFLNFMNFFYDVIDRQVVQLSFQGKHDLSRERSRFIYFVWISHKG